MIWKFAKSSGDMVEEIDSEVLPLNLVLFI